MELEKLVSLLCSRPAVAKQLAFHTGDDKIQYRRTDIHGCSERKGNKYRVMSMWRSSSSSTDRRSSTILSSESSFANPFSLSLLACSAAMSSRANPFFLVAGHANLTRVLEICTALTGVCVGCVVGSVKVSTLSSDFDGS